MELPIEIKEKIEESLCAYPIKEVREVAFKIIDNYKNETQKGKELIDNDLFAKVYAYLRMPATYAASYTSLEKARELFNDKIETILDVGAGTGAASIASNILYNPTSLTLLERNRYMQKVGEEIISLDSDLSRKAKYVNLDLNNDFDLPNHDLVVSSYVFNELPMVEVRKTIRKLWNKTNKVLLVVEPGTPIGYKVIKEIREEILSLGGYIIAPCPHMDKCPMKEDDWCHFSVRISRSKLYKLIKNADVPYEDEKYSYIAFSKSQVKRKDNRVLRHPNIYKGLVSLELCTNDGIKKEDIRKNDPRYKKARKAKPGDNL